MVPTGWSRKTRLPANVEAAADALALTVLCLGEQNQQAKQKGLVSIGLGGGSGRYRNADP